MSEREIPICPLLLITSEEAEAHCKLEKCAWYDKKKEECVIVLIARDLSSIAYTVYTKAVK